jgi:hypothetical protein
MAARLNLNEHRYFSWKGKTISQITSSIKKNKNTNAVSVRNLFLANPLKIYRREIASPFDTTHCSRISMSIDELTRPNGSINNSTSSIKNGLVNAFDNTLPNNVCEEPGPAPNMCILSPGENAKRRCRSSGNVKRQFDISKNNDTYYTSSNQYLVSRNRTFQQNQYNYIRQGNSTSKPGDSLSSANVYSPNGINHCRKYHIATDISFQYQWIDATYNTVSIPAGYYAIEEVNEILKRTMAANFHYYIIDSAHNSDYVPAFVNNYIYNQNIAFLLNIGYNNNTDKVELQVVCAGGSLFPTSKYMISTHPNVTWTTPTNKVVPGFKILANSFQAAIGFSAGDYPSSIITTPVSSSVQSILTNQTFFSISVPGIQPTYVKLYYKPNNSQFAQQGAVSASSLITRIKYDSITNSTVPYRNAYGTSVASALAYGGPETAYTNKDKIGYPNKKTPVFPKYSNTMQICSSTHISG